MTNRSRNLLIALIGIGVAALGLIFIRNLIDFPVYYAAGKSLLNGKHDLYSPDFALGPLMGYRYPPLFILAFTPLSLAPYPVAAYFWYLLSAGQIVGSVIVWRSASIQTRLPGSVWLVALLATAQYFVMVLHYGNAHLLTVFLLLASLSFFVRGSESVSALLMALSISIKPIPLLMLPYFIVKKRWKFAGLVLGFLVAINLLPSLYFGFGGNTRLLKTWYSHVLVDQEFHEVNGPINLSLKGQLRRYLSDVDYTQRIDGDTFYPEFNVASLSQTDTVWVIVALIGSIATLLMVLWTTGADTVRSSSRIETSDVERSVLCLELGLMICLTLFIGPLTSKIYFISLLWPVLSLAAYSFGSSAAGTKISRRVLMLIAITNLVLPLLPGRSIQRLLLVLGADFYINILLMLVLGHTLLSARMPARSSIVERKTQALLETRTP